MLGHEWVTIPGACGALEGVLTVSPGSRRAGVICHPHPLYGGDMNNPIVQAIESGMQRSAMTTLRFNFRGVGESEGAHDHGRGEVDDLRSAVEFVRTTVEATGVVLAGYSFGAMVALAAAAGTEGLAAVIAVAPPLALMPLPNGNACGRELFVVGDHDQYCPLPAAQAATATAPQRCLRVITGADHFLNEAASEIRRLVNEFLAIHT